MGLRHPRPPPARCWTSQCSRRIAPVAEQQGVQNVHTLQGDPGRSKTNPNRGGPMGPDGAPGSCDPGNECSKLGETRSGPPREPALAPPGGGTLRRGASEAPHAALCSLRSAAEPRRGPGPLRSGDPLWESGQRERSAANGEGTAGHRRVSVSGRTRSLSLEQGACDRGVETGCVPWAGVPRLRPRPRGWGPSSASAGLRGSPPQGPAAKTFGCPCRPGKAPPPRSTCPGPSAS